MIMFDIPLRLLVGLGNPGSGYKYTRHNVGFMVIDRFIEEVRAKPITCHRTYDSQLWSYRKKGVEIVVQKPLTYMNLSGKAVLRLCQQKKITPSEVLIIYDDIDLPLGKIRLRRTGSSGGHRGIDSIITSLEASNFNRLRIGVGLGKQVETKNHVVDYVLSPFSDSEHSLVCEVLEVAVQALLMSISQGIVASMNAYNGLIIKVEGHNDETRS